MKKVTKLFTKPKRRQVEESTPSEMESSSQRSEKRLNLPEQKVFSLSTSEEEPKLPDENAHVELIAPVMTRFRAVAPVTSLGEISLDVADLPLETASFGKVVKATDDISPIIAFVKLEGNDWVVKARTRDVFDHVVNSKLLRALSIAGVHAPITEKLSSEAARQL